MSLLQDVTESEIPKDGNMPCGICPEGIADKAFPPDPTARRRCFYATVRSRVQGAEISVQNIPERIADKIFPRPRCRFLMQP